MAVVEQQPIELFNVHLIKQEDRVDFLLHRYYPVRVLGKPNLTPTKNFMRSMVFEVKPTQPTAGYRHHMLVMKIQPAETKERLELSKAEVTIHWLITQLYAIGLRRPVGSAAIRDDRSMLQEIISLECANVIRLFDWGVEHYQPDFLMQRGVGVPGSHSVSGVAARIRQLLPHGTTVSGLLTPLDARPLPRDRAKNPLILATIMEHGQNQLTQLLSGDQLDDSFLLPVMAQSLQFLHSMTGLWMSTFDAHTDNIYVDDAPPRIQSIGFVYYRISRNEVLRVPAMRIAGGNPVVKLVKFTDFGYSVLHTKDTADREWDIKPAHDRFAGYKTGVVGANDTPVADQAGLVFSPAYDFIRLATSVLYFILETSEPDRNAVFARCSDTIQLLHDMIRAAKPPKTRGNLQTAFEQVLLAITTLIAVAIDKKSNDPRGNADLTDQIDIIKRNITTSDWQFRTISTFDELQVWPLDMIRRHFRNWIKTPAVIDTELRPHSDEAKLCADLTLRPSPGAKNRFMPETVDSADAAKAAYNHNAQALRLPTK